MKLSRIKGALRSRTIWFNTISGVFLVALPEMKEALPALREFIPAEIYRMMIPVIVLGNIWLRAITTQSLEDKS